MAEEKQKKKALGKGLEALFGEINTEAPVQRGDGRGGSPTEATQGINYISIDDIKPNGMQPRKNFDDDAINSLADSIKEHGLIQPVMVRSRDVGYELVAGERRWRAARKAGLKEIPAIIRDLEPRENALFAVIENMQREDLNPVEEAGAYKKIIESFGLTQEEVAKSVGKSRPYVANMLRMLKLPDKIREYIISGSLTAGHANAIGSLKSIQDQTKLAEYIVSNKLSVREAEKAAERMNSAGDKRKKARQTNKSAEISSVEEELTSLLGTRVNIGPKAERGTVEIHYYSREELNGLIDDLRSIAGKK